MDPLRDHPADRAPRRRRGLHNHLTAAVGQVHRVDHAVQDFRDRARPNRRTFIQLARVGALDSFIGYDRPRRHELLTHVRRVTAAPACVAPTQLAFDFDLPVPRLEGVTAIDLHGRTQTDLELQELGVAMSDHRMTRFHPLFRELGVTPAHSLIDLPGGTEVLVAGVRRATNTPPMRNGRRTIFVTLDDGTAVANLVFFPDAQERIKGAVLFTDYLIVRGTTRRSGAGGISVTGHLAWDLVDVARRHDADKHHVAPAVARTAASATG